MTADLALAADPGFLERSADPAGFVIQACERAKVWLSEALQHGDIGQIVEVKSQAEAVRVYTMQKQLGKDAQLSAAEIVRRAERGIGVAIRRGQHAGEFRAQGEGSKSELSPDSTKLSPAVYAGTGQGRVDTYAMTDGVSDEAFEEALAEAKSEANLSRTNVARITKRKAGSADPANWVPAADDRSTAAAVRRRELVLDYAARGYSSRQISGMAALKVETVRLIAREMDIEISADAVIGKTRNHDSSRIVRETVQALEGLVMGIELVDLDQLDPAEAKDWVVSFTSSTRTLNRFRRQMKEMTR